MKQDINTRNRFIIKECLELGTSLEIKEILI